METLLQSAVDLLNSGQGFAFAAIISQDGSTPRGAGTKMLVLPDSIVGTIGGGGMEGDVIAAARTPELKAQKVALKTYCMDSKEAAVTDFICGGNCEIVIAWIDADNAGYRAVFEAARAAEERGESAWLIYVVDAAPGAAVPFQLCINVGGERVIGDFVENEYVARAMLLSPARAALHGDGAEQMRFVVDAVNPSGVMVLFGAGHVSQEVAAIARRLEFRVLVVDDRAAYANTVRFPGCECVVVDSYDHVPDFDIPKDCYMLVITRGHAHDKTALEYCLKKNPFYIGMIGSINKRDNIYGRLLTEGYTQRQLDAVHAPIGLGIGAETPAEIAVSILAEIVAVRHGVRA